MYTTNMLYWLALAIAVFKGPLSNYIVLLDFSLTVKAAPYECVIKTSQP